MLPKIAATVLYNWFIKTKRAFPWRKSPNPYQVWVSEVMLQQTQSSRVVSFYERWMARFPDIHALALASIEEVFKYWEGLGYYSRARALHKAARLIVEKFEGKIPDEQEVLLSIHGLGPYTSAAICAFGFHKKIACVDANVFRVIARLFAISDDIQKASVQKNIRERAQLLLPEKEPWVISEALIELGACVCKKQPLCHECPVKQYCQSYKQGIQHSLPISSKKTTYEALFREVCVISSEAGFLLRKGKKGMPCAGLYEFPFFDCLEGGMDFEETMKKIESEFGLRPKYLGALDEEKQSFTRFRLRLYPKRFYACQVLPVPSCEWVLKEDMQKLTFASAHLRIVQQHIKI
jgi:A/G-specific adenine glycosylase